MNMNNRTTEKDLINVAVMALSCHAIRSRNTEVPSEKMRASVMRMIEPFLTAEDKEILPSGNSARRIDQVARNLVSNRTLDNAGYTIYNPETRTFTVTEKCFEKASDLAMQIILKEQVDSVKNNKKEACAE
ncbi:hypothetical protein ACTOJ1_000853 [Shigella flexneri]